MAGLFIKSHSCDTAISPYSVSSVIQPYGYGGIGEVFCTVYNWEMRCSY